MTHEHVKIARREQGRLILLLNGRVEAVGRVFREEAGWAFNVDAEGVAYPRGHIQGTFSTPSRLEDGDLEAMLLVLAEVLARRLATT